MIMNIRTLICALFIAAFLFSAGCTKGTTDSSAIPTHSPVAAAQTVTVNPAIPADASAPVTPSEIKAFVDSAATYAQQAKKAAALAAFNDPKGPFVKGSVYVYALDYNGTTLALPFQRDLVGQDFSMLSDATGQKFVKTEISLAKNGGGFLLFQYPNPEHSNAIEPKLSYVRPVDDTYWIGAGTYISGNSVDDTRVKTFVEEAKAYTQKNGKDLALAAFNRQDGDFIKDDLYIFAYDYSGNVLAWPYRPDQIGMNRINETDLLGKEHIKEMVATAKRGNGTVLYFSINPLHNNATELKSSYVLDIDGTWFIGAGTYLAPGTVTPAPVSSSVPVPIRTSDELVKYVQEAKAYALRQGREMALYEFNNKNGQFTHGESYIFAYTSNGTTLALPYQTELIGTSRWNTTDPDGVRYIQEMARTAEGGSGFVQYRYPDPAENFSVKVKTSYVVDVDGSWFVGSGIYTKD
jgi:polar amino acid transport system substrate-binding protein